MSALEIGGLALAIELGLIAWLILFMLLRRQGKAQQADEAHAGAMMEEMRAKEPSRRDALTQLFEKTYRLEGEELSEKVEEFVEREKAFYNAMSSIYMERDGERLKQVPGELAKVLAPWVQMTPSGMVDESTLGELETEKAALTVELEETKHSLEELMEEYTAAFSRASATPAAQSPPARPAPPAEPEPEPAEPPADDGSPEADQTLDESYFDIQSEEAPATTAETATEPPVSEPEPEPEPDETADPFSTPEPRPQAAAPEPPVHELAEDAAATADLPADDELADELARQELEGLADLFDTPPDKD